MVLQKVLHSQLNITYYEVFNAFLHDSQIEQNAQQDPLVENGHFSTSPCD
jgi:hypothetical protein